MTQEKKDNPTTGILRRYLTVKNVSIFVFTLFAYAMLAMKNGYMLRWYDEMSLFEPTRFFFNEFINYPGGIFRYAGTWLTQLMYYPELGSGVLVALWMLLAWMTCRAFRLRGSAAALALIIPLMMLASVVQLDEAWLTLKTPGYIFSNTLGYIYAAAMIALFRISAKWRLLHLSMPALITLTYCLAGFYALLAAAACLVTMLVEAVRGKEYVRLIVIAATAVLIAEIPSVYFTFWHGTRVDNDYLLLKGLPELLFESFDIYLWIPFVAASEWFVVLALLKGLEWTNESRITPWVSSILLLLTMAWVVRADHKSEQLRASVLMMRLLEQNNWNSISNLMTRLREEPNYTMLVINNLANAHQGRKTVNLSRMTPKPADGRHNESFTMTVFVDVPVNYYLGKNNESYRWCMEHTVQYGKRVFFLKYMVKNAIVNGEYELARKYNDILKRTMFHSKWAADMEKYIDNPSLADSNAEFKAIRGNQF